MTIKEIEGFEYDEEEVKGVCRQHGGPLIDAPIFVHRLSLTAEERDSFDAGIWGVGYCPKGKHFLVWTLAEYPLRTGATPENPLGGNIIFPLDNFGKAE